MLSLKSNNRALVHQTYSLSYPATIVRYNCVLILTAISVAEALRMNLPSSYLPAIRVVVQTLTMRRLRPAQLDLYTHNFFW